jgi:hypothetical protein
MLGRNPLLRLWIAERRIPGDQEAGVGAGLGTGPAADPVAG